MTLRSILALTFTVEQLRQHYQLDTEAILARHGLQQAHLDANATISQADELAILAEFADQIQHDPLAAITIGSTFGLSSYGAFAMMLMSCSSVYEAFALGIKYQQLSYLFSELDYQLDGDTVLLKLKPYPLPDHLQRFIVDRDVAGTWHFLNIMQTMLGRNLKPLAIRMPYLQPAEAAAYREKFQCPVEFGCDEAAFVLPLEVLRLPFPGANATALELYRGQCEEIIKQRSQVRTEALSERLKQYLTMFSQRFPAIKDCAATFGLSERQFRRLLSDEGLSFQQILDNVRAEKACHLLRHSSHSVEKIALLLGYSEAAGFIHAFKKWQNITPAQYRKQTAEKTEPGA